MTIEDRKTGWLDSILHYRFREILTHTAFRFGLCCPIYCCMPNHLHLFWVGILDACDQLLAVRYFRRQINAILEKFGVRFQREAHDHVLKEEEREHAAFEDIFDYIARNPERAGLVSENRFSTYPYTGCLLPGYPELNIWDADFQEQFWSIYAHLRAHGLIHAIGDL